VQAAKFAGQVCAAMAHCHRRGVVHRDLKSENLLLTQTGDVKVADFGWAAVVKRGERRKTFCGTLDYVAPEMASGDGHDCSVDVWAVGVLVYEFLCGAPPFEARGREATYRRISDVDLRFPDHVTETARDCIRQLLRRDAAERTSLCDILKHDFFTQYAACDGDEKLRLHRLQKADIRRVDKAARAHAHGGHGGGEGESVIGEAALQHHESSGDVTAAGETE
jgi:serine/threonine protein kinase